MAIDTLIAYVGVADPKAGHQLVNKTKVVKKHETPTRVGVLGGGVAGREGYGR